MSLFPVSVRDSQTPTGLACCAGAYSRSGRGPSLNANVSSRSHTKRCHDNCAASRGLKCRRRVDGRRCFTSAASRCPCSCIRPLHPDLLRASYAVACPTATTSRSSASSCKMPACRGMQAPCGIAHVLELTHGEPLTAEAAAAGGVSVGIEAEVAAVVVKPAAGVLHPAPALRRPY